MERPKCSCGNLAKKQGFTKDGAQKYAKHCGPCGRRKYNQKRACGRRYLNHAATSCSRCGFVAEHRCQLDMDHIDGDRDNYAPENLQILCANCHRLKTLRNGDCNKKAQ